MPALVFAGQALAQERPWRASFLLGGFDGEAHHGGLMIKMQPGWKTYWRVPGAGGIPPDVSASGSNVRELRLEYPLPRRHNGEDGQSIGYLDEVVFPFRLVPHDPSGAVEATFKAFIGICEIVCIPVRHEEQHKLQPDVGTLPDNPMIQRWRQRVPEVVAAGPVQKAEALEVDGKAILALTLNAAVKDIYVEGAARHYFSEPRFSTDGQSAIMDVHGAKSASDIRGQQLRITLDLAGRGVEQGIAVV